MGVWYTEAPQLAEGTWESLPQKKGATYTQVRNYYTWYIEAKIGILSNGHPCIQLKSYVAGGVKLDYVARPSFAFNVDENITSVSYELRVKDQYYSRTRWYEFTEEPSAKRIKVSCDKRVQGLDGTSAVYMDVPEHTVSNACIRVNDEWKQIALLATKVNGEWKPMSKMSVNVNGEWKGS